MNGTSKYLIDTNILIYFFDGVLQVREKEQIIKILNSSFVISVITKIEFLGFKGFFNNQQYDLASKFIQSATILPLDDILVPAIIAIKQQYNLKLGDAIIASTALQTGRILLTRNTKDFEKVDKLEIFNPFSPNT